MSRRLLLILLLTITFLFVGCVDDKNKEFLLKFETYGGQYIQSQKVKKGDYATRPLLDPIKDGFIFIDWYEDSKFTNIFNFNVVKIEKDITVYAKFIENENQVINKYKIKFVDNLNNVIEEVIYDEGQLIIKPNDPKKEGWTFNGWYLNDELFTFNVPITSNLTIKAKFTQNQMVTETYTIELNANGGTLENNIITVEEGQEFTLPTPIHPEGYEFIGWFDESDHLFTQTTINKNIVLFAKYASSNVGSFVYDHGSYPEAIWIEVDGYYQSVNVRYKLSDQVEYQILDSELIRKKDNKTLIDILGLKTGFYDVEILINNNELIKLNQIQVKPHDRSGYAHFNYTEGIGAYNDDGTLKSNAIVIYVTEENKNTITIPGINQVGLGWILNNAQYSSSTSSTYNQAEYNNSLAKFNMPLLFRFIGRVTAPEGVTAYNSTVNGGSVGDNGFMARIKDANHITMEGVGEGAEIFGWGIHFMASTTGRGIGFEIRNLTFDKYPEDAVGLEGVQSGSVLTAPVQRGWIHNSTFKQGFCANPAEADKAFGDGSLDIKRGEYFTISYNQFLDARKTNLIGASDSNLQFHLTYHHNLWLNAASRTPLTRKGNVHMYNNVFMISDDNQGEPGYAMNTRADAYIFSEANYFYAIKRPFLVSGGAIKSFGDVLYSTYGEHNQVTVNQREELVDTNNKYKNFDTNPSIFYYDSINKKSNVSHLTDSITAKKEVMSYSGTYRKVNVIIDSDHYVTNITPVQINQSTTVPGGKITKGNPFYVFELLTNAQFEMVEGTASYKPRLVTIYGEEILTGSGSVLLTPGIYVVESQQSHGASKGVSQAKDSYVNSITITIESEEIKQQRINNFNEALSKIPTNLTYTQENIDLVNNAELAYNQLLEDEKLLVNGEQLQTIINNLINLGRVHIEALINDIGVVTESSFDKIHLARNTYNKARIKIRNQITNYETLVNAENTFKQFEVINLVNAINNATSYEKINRLDINEINSLNMTYLELETRYLNLSTEDQININNYNKITTNLNEINLMLLAHEIKGLVNIVVNVKDYLDEIIKAYTDYQTLSVENKAILTAQEVEKLNTYYQEAEQIKNERIEQVYHFEGTNPYFTLGPKAKGCDVVPSITYNGIEIKRGLKLESGTEISFTASSNFRIIMKFIAGESIKINGKIIQITNGEIILDLPAGTHIITRVGNPQARLIYIVVIENY